MAFPTLGSSLDIFQGKRKCFQTALVVYNKSKRSELFAMQSDSKDSYLKRQDFGPELPNLPLKDENRIQYYYFHPSRRKKRKI
jgi:hypothetical protein